MTNRSFVADMTRSDFEAVFELLAKEVSADFDSYDLPAEARVHVDKVCSFFRLIELTMCVPN